MELHLQLNYKLIQVSTSRPQISAKMFVIWETK